MAPPPRPITRSSGLLSSVSTLPKLTTFREPEFTTWRLNLKDILKLEGLWVYVNNEVKEPFPSATLFNGPQDGCLELRLKMLQASAVIMLAMSREMRATFEDARSGEARRRRGAMEVAGGSMLLVAMTPETSGPATMTATGGQTTTLRSTSRATTHRWMSTSATATTTPGINNGAGTRRRRLLLPRGSWLPLPRRCLRATTSPRRLRSLLLLLLLLLRAPQQRSIGIAPRLVRDRDGNQLLAVLLVGGVHRQDLGRPRLRAVNGVAVEVPRPSLVLPRLLARRPAGRLAPLRLMPPSLRAEKANGTKPRLRRAPVDLAGKAQSKGRERYLIFFSALERTANRNGGLTVSLCQTRGWRKRWE
ncbi:hypothetical protein FN846DRAFT_406995 [Sphaerosporella brunnea]|uniref:Uncharacterized protein n=1 Tax=Sphaerosporella brunnea TaxID=1250544 RepID=A0A5J5EFS8_9PEZI|nr:hypothetical protein FN846DRAFT_406995 [Sphaerosporella brunnea]